MGFGIQNPTLLMTIHSGYSPNNGFSIWSHEILILFKMAPADQNFHFNKVSW